MPENINKPSPKNLESYIDYIKKSCQSMFEGCMCYQKKNHDDLHQCNDSKCTTTWTTDQSKEWWKKFKRYRGI